MSLVKECDQKSGYMVQDVDTFCPPMNNGVDQVGALVMFKMLGSFHHFWKRCTWSFGGKLACNAADCCNVAAVKPAVWLLSC